MRVIDRILEIMESKGISAYKIAQDTGINQSSFSNWKKGVEPPANKIEILFQYLEVTPNEVYGYEQPKSLLTAPEEEMLTVMERLDEQHQWRAIGIVEDYADKHPKQSTEKKENDEEDRSSDLKIS